MTVSVVVPTFNGAHKLPTIIKAISKQSIQPAEILIVVDGSTDNTLQVLDELQKDLPNLLIISQENKGRSIVRNNGANKAQGELLVFFDDDMLPEADCLKEHLTHHQRFPGSIVTGGIIDLHNERSEIQKYKAALCRKWSKPLKNRRSVPLLADEISLTAANFSISKKLFFDLGAFDERLTDAEDFDLGVRAFKAGVSLYFNYNAFAWHKDDVTGLSYIRRLRQYHRAHKLLKELKPDTYVDVKQNSLILPTGAKEKLFRLFATKYWVDWLDKSSWKFLLPKQVRYKLYDLIITANGVFYPDKVMLN